MYIMQQNSTFRSKSIEFDCMRIMYNASLFFFFFLFIEPIKSTLPTEKDNCRRASMNGIDSMSPIQKISQNNLWWVKLNNREKLFSTSDPSLF